MSEKNKYYVILFTDNLTFLTDDGYPSQDVTKADKYTSFNTIKQQLENLDDDYKQQAKIYEVEEQIEYTFRKLGE